MCGLAASHHVVTVTFELVECHRGTFTTLYTARMALHSANPTLQCRYFHFRFGAHLPRTNIACTLLRHLETILEGCINKCSVITSGRVLMEPHAQRIGTPNQPNTEGVRWRRADRKMDTFRYSKGTPPLHCNLNTVLKYYVISQSSKAIISITTTVVKGHIPDGR